MTSLVDQILEWPVIIQGALGSGVFWLILLLGDKLIKFSSKHTLAFSKKQRIELLGSEILRYKGLLAPGMEAATLSTVGLIYEAVKYISWALSAITLGLLLSEILGVFSTIGYLVAIYYLFLAAHAVRDIKSSDPEIMKSHLAALEAKRDSLKQSA
ncbi:hypothetical protein ACF8C6_13700 [Pseudomonas sp. zbq_18]|uniref:hypothetical protein n=1 Tax=Pseudomonas sp. zbq_18 TaxID=3367251 RepID=UPI00370BD3E9